MPPNVKPLNNHGRVCLLRVRGLCIQCVFICAFLDVLHTISIICIVSLSHCRTVARGKMPRMFRLMTFQRFFYMNILTSECYILLYCGHIKHSWTSEMKIITAFTHHAMASKYRTRQKYVYKHCVCVARSYEISRLFRKYHRKRNKNTRRAQKYRDVCSCTDMCNLLSSVFLRLGWCCTSTAKIYEFICFYFSKFLLDVLT